MKRCVGVLGVGAYVPDRVVTNDDLVARGLDTSDDWIKERSGIQARRVASPEQRSSDLAFEAAQQAIQRSGLSAQDLDGIVVATSTPDYAGFPSVASMVQHRLGLRHVSAFDVSAACSGFNYALNSAYLQVLSGQMDRCLVVAADCLSQVIQWTDRSTCVLFGDGAGAVVVGEVPDSSGILYTRLYCDGTHGDILKVQRAEPRHDFDAPTPIENSPYIFMNGKAVFKVAVHAVQEAIETALRDTGFAVSDFKAVVFHQANLRLMSAIQDRLGFTNDQFPVTLHKYGNTSAASIPITLADMDAHQKLSRGDLVLLAGFGGGFTWGITIIRW